jgi:tetratricopeptide (TPR) repeat protein
METHRETIEQHHRAAQTAMDKGDLRQVHQHCLAILKLDQTHADAWFLCAVIAAHNGQVAKSVDILQRAITLAPGIAEYQAEMGKQLVALHRHQEALAAAQAALELAPAALPVLNTLGTVFSHLGEHEQAVSCYRKAVSTLANRKAGVSRPADSWQADLYFNLAASLNFTGEQAEAEKNYEHAIELQPRLHKAHSALSQLRRQSPERNHIPRLLQLREQVSSAGEQLHIGHALAKEHEDLEQYPEALESLQWAKSKRASEVDYRAGDDAALFDSVEKAFHKGLFKSNIKGCDSTEPVFIVGMPRTGTTLVERMLASHTRVFAAGELQNFPLQVKRLTETPSADVLDVPTLENSVQLNMVELGQRYLDSTRPRTGHTAHFIDKLPLNFLYLGLIHLALPGAKLICLRRDPMDTCLSNYRQLFATEFKYYHYSYDLLDCGRYYLEFDKLMRHWQNVMPGVVHEVQYEDLVAEPERVSRELVAFCELDWEPRCLEFHTQQGSVATPSATQVRQPIYNSSVNRWRRYGENMQPLFELLSSAGCYP